MNPSSNLFLVGPMGAGKTTLGRALAAAFGLDCLDLDSAIESATGASIEQIFEHEGEAGFRARESRQLQQACACHDLVLACGGGVVVAAANRQLLARNGFVVHLHVGVDEQLQRLRHDRSRPLLAAADRRQRLEILARERDPLYADVADLRIDCDRAGLAATRAGLIRRIDAAWRRMPGLETTP